MHVLRERTSCVHKVPSSPAPAIGEITNTRAGGKIKRKFTQTGFVDAVGLIETEGCSEKI